jgi:hypothetical protein
MVCFESFNHHEEGCDFAAKHDSRLRLHELSPAKPMDPKPGTTMLKSWAASNVASATGLIGYAPAKISKLRSVDEP